MGGNWELNIPYKKLVRVGALGNVGIPIEFEPYPLTRDDGQPTLMETREFYGLRLPVAIKGSPKELSESPVALNVTLTIRRNFDKVFSETKATELRAVSGSEPNMFASVLFTSDFVNRYSQNKGQTLKIEVSVTPTNHPLLSLEVAVASLPVENPNTHVFELGNAEGEFFYESVEQSGHKRL